MSNERIDVLDLVENDNQHRKRTVSARVAALLIGVSEARISQMIATGDLDCSRWHLPCGDPYDDTEGIPLPAIEFLVGHVVTDGLLRDAHECLRHQQGIRNWRGYQEDYND